MSTLCGYGGADVWGATKLFWKESATPSHLLTTPVPTRGIEVQLAFCIRGPCLCQFCQLCIEKSLKVASILIINGLLNIIFLTPMDSNYSHGFYNIENLSHLEITHQGIQVCVWTLCKHCPFIQETWASEDLSIHRYRGTKSPNIEGHSPLAQISQTLAGMC